MASINLITKRGSLGGNDYVDWVQFGAGAVSVPNPSVITSNLGITGTVAKESAGVLAKKVQGVSWAGNFAPGDNVIWTNSTTGAMIINFDSPVSGVGAEICGNAWARFIATIEVYDVNNVLLGSFNLNGRAGYFSPYGYADNPAIFVGVTSNTLSNIDHVYYYLNNRAEHFAINRLDLVTTSVITNYLTTLGVDSTLSGYISTYVNRMAIQFAIINDDESLVVMLEKNLPNILQVASAVYGLGYNATQIESYIKSFFPDFSSEAALYSNVIATDINNMIDTPVAEWIQPYTYSAKQVYLKNATKVLTDVIRYMRHFARLDDKNLH